MTVSSNHGKSGMSYHPSMRKLSFTLSQSLGRLVFSTKSGPLAVALRSVFRFKRRWIGTDQGTFLIDPFSHFGYYLVRDGIYEPELMGFLQEHLSDGDVFVDAGAHEGYFGAIAAKHVGSTGRVIAFEPQSRVRPILEQNIKANRLTNVTVVPVAISDTEGEGILHLGMGWNTGGTGFTNISRFRMPTEKVRTRPLAAVLQEQGVTDVALIKMDIEGFEYELVLGSPSLFKEQRVKTIAIELHANQMRARGKRPEDIGDFLTDCGYTLDMVSSKNLGTHFATMVYVR